MDYFNRKGGALHAGNVSLTEIARRFGTPTYVYAADQVCARYRELKAALVERDHGSVERGHGICYAVKANPNLALLRLLVKEGSGFDIVSGGELKRVLRAGGDPRQIVFSGVGKTAEEIEQALAVGIGCFNVESAQELDRLEEQARKCGRRAPVAIRVNPDIDAGTHPYISTGLKNTKFGVPMAEARELYRRIRDSNALEALGVHCHIGSQLMSLDPLLGAVRRLVELVDALAADGINLEYLNMGGGLGVCYEGQTPLNVQTYVKNLMAHMGDRKLKLLLEPGRWLVADAGVLLVRVEYVKRNEERCFLVVDGAMNDFLRPVLYQAHHDIELVRASGDAPAECVDIVGPVCESADFFGRGRQLSARAGDLLVVRAAGAYGFTMSSNYNSRGRAAEVLVKAGEAHLARRRETIEEQLALEEVEPVCAARLGSAA